MQFTTGPPEGSKAVSKATDPMKQYDCLQIIIKILLLH